MITEKWTTLTHNGILFPEPYSPRGIHLAELETSLKGYPKAEEMLWHYAAKLETEYVKNKTFNKNFFKCLKPHLPVQIQGKAFPADFLGDIESIHNLIIIERESQKAKTTEEKEAIRDSKQALREKYGYATLDGKRMPLSSFMVEPSGIFIGRGNNPLHGTWKDAAKPEDVTLNISSSIPVPPPPEGHQWGSVVENREAYWIASYPVDAVGKRKFIMFGATSEVKQNSDQQKFSKAIHLLKNWDKLRRHVERNLTSKFDAIKQSAMVAYLIMMLGIRVGDEKDEDEADTVGASTLRYEHVKLDGDKLSLDFLGKDSIRYKNTIKVHPDFATSLVALIDGKKKGDLLFPVITSQTVNAFLKEAVEGVSAKQFRTAYGSKLLAEALRDTGITTDSPLSKKLLAFYEANKIVAEKLNHKKAPSKNYKEQVQALKDSLKKAREEYSTTYAEIDSKIIAIDAEIDRLRQLGRKSETTERVKLLREKKQTLREKVQRAKEKVVAASTKLTLKEGTKDIALGTSKTNYSDPRITISWCRKNNVPLEKVLPKSLQSKFEWALEPPDDYYEAYPEVE